MKKTLFTCLALITIGLCLFVSCSAQGKSPEEVSGIAYITFDSSNNRSLEASYDIADYDQLYWFYTATKDDKYGDTGETSYLKPVATSNGNSATPAKGLKGTIGPFSQGAWKFTLAAYSDLNTSSNGPGNNKVYATESDISVTLIGGETKSIPATVKPYGETGSLKFKDAYFKWENPSSDKQAPYIIITATSVGTTKSTYTLTNDSSVSGTNIIKIVLGSYDQTKSGYPIKYVVDNNGTTYTDTLSNIPVAYYSANIKAYLPGSGSVGTAVAEQKAFGFSIYGGATTVVSGDITEDPDTYATFDVAKTEYKAFIAKQKEATIITTSVAPVENASGSDDKNKTTVEFESAALDTASADSTSYTYNLSVEALSASAANDSFSVTSESDSKEVYGSLKLSLDKIDNTTNTSTPITSFGNKKVTISTYITPGLGDNNVTVRYTGSNGEQPTDVSYTSSSGLLTFKTTHFSDFVVVSSKPALFYVANLKKSFTTFDAALKASESIKGSVTIKLNADAEISGGIAVTKDLTIDLNSKKLTLKDPAGNNTAKYIFKITAPFTVKNGSIDGNVKYSVFRVESNGDLTIDNVNDVTINTVSAGSNAAKSLVFMYQGSNPASATIKNSKLTMIGSYCVGSNAEKGAASNINVVIDNSTIKAENGSETTLANDDTTALLINVPGNVVINKSTIEGRTQGAILRGATSTITDSTIKATSSNSSTAYDNSDWGVGNGVPQAALVIGNRSSNGSYPYPTTVTFGNNVKLECTDTKNKNLYVYQASEEYPVTVSGAVDSAWTVNDDMHGAYYPGVEAKIGNYHYKTLQSAITAATENSTVDVLRDIDLKLSSLAKDSAYFSITKPITINGNGYKLSNNDKISVSGISLISITNVSGDISLNNINFESSTWGSYMCGLKIGTKNANITLDNVSISLPHYYAVSVLSGSDHTSLKISNSTLKGWVNIYNRSSNFKVEADNSTFVSINSLATGGDSNSCSSIIVSNYYEKDEKSEKNEMTFNTCTFEVSKTYESSDVTQKVADLRSPCNNVLRLNNCIYAPAKGSPTFAICSDSTYKGNVVDEKDKRTNKIYVDGEEIAEKGQLPLVKWYIDAN